MATDKVKKILAEIPKHRRWFISYSMEIASQINELIKEEDNFNQNKLAEILGKKPSEISKWLSGSHNFTIETIAKISEALDKKILLVPMYAKENFEITDSMISMIANKAQFNETYQNNLSDIQRAKSPNLVKTK